MTTMNITVIPGSPCEGAEHHGYGEPCQWAGGPGGATPPRIVVSYSYAFCNNGSQLGGTSPIDIGNPHEGPGGDDGTTTPGNTNTITPAQNNNEDEDEVITTPVVPGFDQALTPCIALKQLLNEGLKAKIQTLNIPGVLNLNYEKGFDFQENANGQVNFVPNNGSPNQTFINVVVNEEGTVTGHIHSHFNSSLVTPFFTIEDLKTFNAIYQWRKFSGKPLDKISVMVVSRAGVFAMTIEDFQKMETYGNKLQTNDFISLSKEYNGKLRNLSDEDIIKQNLQSFSKFGVRIYKANSNLTSWDRMSYNSTTNQIDYNPCN